MEMQLFNYYSLDECSELKVIKKRLTQLENDGKINFKVDSEILRIIDLELDESEVEELIEMFDKFDVIPYPDYEEDIQDDEYYDDYDDFDGDEY